MKRYLFNNGRKRHLFHNTGAQLLAFSVHDSGTNLPDIHPLHPWRPVDDNGYLDVIYDWGPEKLLAMSRCLRTQGYFVFSPRRTYERKGTRTFRIGPSSLQPRQ